MGCVKLPAASFVENPEVTALCSNPPGEAPGSGAPKAPP